MAMARNKLVRVVAGWMLTGSMLLFSIPGMVLCVGDEGHVAVESAHHDHKGHRVKRHRVNVTGSDRENRKRVDLSL